MPVKAWFSCHKHNIIIEISADDSDMLNVQKCSISCSTCTKMHFAAGHFSKVFGSENCCLALSGEKLLFEHKNKHRLTPNQVLHPDR